MGGGRRGGAKMEERLKWSQHTRARAHTRTHTTHPSVPFMAPLHGFCGFSVSST